MSGWAEIGGAPPESTRIGGTEIRRGSRVRLAPRAGRDIFDLALAGKTATVESLELDVDGSTHLVVSVDDDPAREFRDHRMPGHRFFFRSDEVEALPDEQSLSPRTCRVLVAGIGNLFLADDGFGVAVIEELRRDGGIDGADIIDFGIRGMDLAYALSRYDTVILVDAAARGHEPGTVAVLDAADAWSPPEIETHAMDPVKVLALARTLGPMPRRLLVVACEPAVLGDDDNVTVGLSPPVTAAIGPAAATVKMLVDEFRTEVQS